MLVDRNQYDAVVIGGGPAGSSCAVWLAHLGFAPVLIEAASRIGGLCRLHSFRDDWNASLPGVTGPQVADNLEVSLAHAKVPLLLSHTVTGVEPTGDGFAVAVSGVRDLVLRAPYVVLATGVTARGLPGTNIAALMTEDSSVWPDSASGIQGSVLIGPGEHIVAQDFQNKRVAVLGGGDNAFENALYAMRHGASAVDLYARTVRAQRQFVRQVPVAHVHAGKYRVDAAAQTVNGNHYDVIMVFYGWEPIVGYAAGLKLHRTARGYVATDAVTAQTSCAGVYAIGEVAQRQHPCVVTALADGVVAAKAIQASIEQNGS